MVIFPLWTKWLVTNPMPTQYWHEQYPKWPSIQAVGGQDLANDSLVTYPIEMSPIPTQSDSCNFSCSSWRGYRTNEMNFRVSLTVNDSILSRGYVHTIYPVLLASADFHDWWVVADRRFAYPAPFWRAKTDKTGHAYTYTTDTCISPPAGDKVTREANSGVYVLACVVWSPTSFAELEAKSQLDDADLGQYCYTAGGVCGWTCDSVVNSDLLEGCTADSTIKMTSSSVAGREIPSAEFQGNVEMRECLKGNTAGKCETATEKFKQWKCHKCLYDPRTEDDMRRRLQIIPGIGGLPSGLPGMDDPDSPLPGALRSSIWALLLKVFAGVGMPSSPPQELEEVMVDYQASSGETVTRRPRRHPRSTRPCHVSTSPSLAQRSPKARMSSASLASSSCNPPGISVGPGGSSTRTTTA